MKTNDVELHLYREAYENGFTRGHLSVNGEYFCDTLEPARDDKEHPCIPCGRYAVDLIWSQKFRRTMPWLRYVPNRSGIEIHVGNYPRDTQGCILVGKYEKPDSEYLVSSRTEFARLYSILEYADEIEIVIDDLPF